MSVTFLEIFVAVGVLEIVFLVLSIRLTSKKWQGWMQVFMATLIFLGFTLGLAGILFVGCFFLLSELYPGFRTGG